MPRCWPPGQLKARRSPACGGGCEQARKEVYEPCEHHASGRRAGDQIGEFCSLRRIAPLRDNATSSSRAFGVEQPISRTPSKSPMDTHLPRRASDTDTTSRLVDAIARELWRLCGAGGRLNWARVDLHLDRMVEQARTRTIEARVVECSAVSDANPRAHRTVRRWRINRVAGARARGNARARHLLHRFAAGPESSTRMQWCRASFRIPRA